MLEPVRVLAIAAVRGPAARLDIGDVPRLGAQAAQGRRGMKGPRPHAHVIRLQDRAAARAPVIVQRQDHVLKAQWCLDRKSVVEGKSGSVRVDLGGRRIIKKKKTTY